MSIDHSIEQYGYRHIPGFPGYCVGDDGSVWSKLLIGSRPSKMGKKWRLMKTSKRRKDNRCRVNLYRNDIVHTRYVHRLVLEAFVGPCPKGMQCAHWDGDASNNKLDNLRWATRKENESDKIRHGTTNRGERCGTSKLTEKQVLEIRRLYKQGQTQRSLGRKFKVSQVTISCICNYKSWRFIQTKRYSNET